MNSEQEIVLFWLERQGFMCLRNIKAGNRSIPLLCFRVSPDALEALHVEILASVSGSESLETAGLRQRFFSKESSKALGDAVARFLPEKKNAKNTHLRRILVTTAEACPPVEGVEVVNMGDVLRDVFRALDTHNYPEPVIRALQLVKRSVFFSPESLASMIASESKALFSPQDLDGFLSALLSKKRALDALVKKKNQPLVEEINSHLASKRPSGFGSVMKKAISLKDERKSKTAERIIARSVVQSKALLSMVLSELRKTQRTLSSFMRKKPRKRT